MVGCIVVENEERQGGYLKFPCGWRLLQQPERVAQGVRFGRLLL